MTARTFTLVILLCLGATAPSAAEASPVSLDAVPDDEAPRAGGLPLSPFLGGSTVMELGPAHQCQDIRRIQGPVAGSDIVYSPLSGSGWGVVTNVDPVTGTTIVHQYASRAVFEGHVSFTCEVTPHGVLAKFVVQGSVVVGP